MVQDLLSRHGAAGYDLWFYTPMALPLGEGLSPGVVIYDCMDELSAFKFAPPVLLHRERDLLARADVVFTGGPSLYRAKKDRHPNCHCFSSSVDRAHFGKAATGGLADPDGQKDIPRPRLGYFGVIDERFDVPLLAALAEARPDWQFVMVGPVVKIDPAELPGRDNIHYLGQQPYEALPAFLGGWDVALLPFARNEATKYISPTKTLEYMAAEKPIVSTPITDVAEPYGTTVGLGDTADEFLAACERVLAETLDQRQARLDRFAGVLARTSWDSTAAAMAGHIETARGHRAARSPAGPGNASPQELAAQTADDPLRRRAASVPLARAADAPVIVIGAGPTGLSAAYHLGEDSILLEANDRVGGWCRSLEDNGFTFDWAGHIMFSNDPYVHEMYRLLRGDNVHWQDREAWIYSKDVYIRYPFQGSLYGLPPDVIKECIVGAVEARYGSLTNKPDPKPSTNGTTNGHASGVTLKRLNGTANGHANGNGHAATSNGNGGCLTNRLLNDKGDSEINDCCADGVAESTVPFVSLNGASEPTKPAGPRNFEEFIYQVWGPGSRSISPSLTTGRSGRSR